MIAGQTYFVPSQGFDALQTSPSQYSQQFDDTLFGDCAWFVILGDPGSGKTTATKKLVLDYVSQAQQQEFGRFSGVPLYVPLRSFARERHLRGQFYPILEFIYDYAAAFLNAPCSPGFFEYFLDAGECLVCFDGLDEVAATGQRQEIRDIVESFVNRYPRNRYLVTSRIVGYEQGALSKRRFAHCTVQPLSDPDINQYVTQWYLAREKSSTYAESRARELSDTIMRSERLRDLARNPLLLTIIALMHRVEAELPHERVKLYEKCTEALLFTFENVKRLDVGDTSKECMRYRRELLEEVAYWMQSERSSETGREAIVEEAELRRQVTDRLRSDPTFSLQKLEAMQQAEVFVRFIKERTGLLVERGDGQYAFVHLTFQEYFAACHIWRTYGDDLDELWAHIEPRLLDASWHEVILLLLGKLSESPRAPSRIVERFLAQEDEYEEILRRRLRLATDCLLDKIRLKIALGDKIVHAWIDIIKKPLCPRQLQLALQAIGELRALPNCNQQLATIAIDRVESPEVRMQIIWLALIHETNQLPTGPGWVIDSLHWLATDHTAPAPIRAYALSLLLDVTTGRDLGVRLCLEMLGGADGECTICVDGLGLHSTSAFRSVEELDPVLRDVDSRIPSAALLAIQAALATWDQSVVHQIATKNPTLAILLGALGWEVAWSWLYEFLCKSTPPDPRLGQLFRMKDTAWLPRFAPDPETYRIALLEKLCDIVEHPASTVELVGSIHWLQRLHCPINKLFDYVLRFDSMVDKDDWNVEVMSEFFTELLGIVGHDYRTAAKFVKFQTDVNLPLETWLNELASYSHLTLQVSFAKALLGSHNDAKALLGSHNDHTISLTKEFIIRLAEQDTTPLRLRVLLSQLDFEKQAWLGLDTFWKARLFELLAHGAPVDSICWVARKLTDNHLLTQEEIIAALRPLLLQDESAWARGSAAYRLFHAQHITETECLKVFEDTMQNEQISWFIRQDAAQHVIVLGGDRKTALSYLRRAVLTDVDEAGAKDAAFNALQELVAPKPIRQEDAQPSYLI